MHKQYLSIKEAMDVTGMSDASLRRLCRKGMKGRDYKYDVEGKLYVNDSFLYASYPPQSKTDPIPMKVDYEVYKIFQKDIVQIKEHTKQYPIDLLKEKDSRIVDLKKEIETKNNTIINLSSAIEGLNTNMGLLTERTREQNIIIQSLQEKVTHQLQPAPSSIKKSIPKIQLIDKILIGVAVLSSIAILMFVAMMLFAYISK